MKQKYLGMLLDTANCEISVPEEKFVNFSEDIKTILKSGKCYLNQLEKTKGRCVSFQLACPMMKLFIRSQTAAITEAYRLGKNVITLDEDLKIELNRWLDSNII